MPINILNKLPKAAKDMWESTYSSAKAKYDEKKAARIAWSAVKKKFKKVEDKWVARSSDFETFITVSYKFIADETTISRSLNDGVTVDYVMGTTKSINGISLSQVALKRLAEQINSEGVTGRIDPDSKHLLFKQLRSQGKTPEEVEEELQKLQTGIKAINARVEGDKLITTVNFSEASYAKAQGFKAVSLEARFPNESVRAGIIDQARLTGFVLTNEPADEDAVKLS